MRSQVAAFKASPLAPRSEPERGDLRFRAFHPRLGRLVEQTAAFTEAQP